MDSSKEGMAIGPSGFPQAALSWCFDSDAPCPECPATRNPLPAALIPLQARHVEHSVIASADDDPARPSARLLDLALQAAAVARSVSLAPVTGRMTQPPYYPDIWPGEHYKLLAGLVSVCRPKLIIEIGTATGLSALAMRHALPPQGRIVSFDIVPWNRFAHTCLRHQDFADGTLSQIIGDPSDPQTLAEHAALFRSADLLFVDGPKDGRFEQTFLDRLREGRVMKGNPLVVLDDIRVWNMLALWRSIRMAKLDITSFGHWSGTGLVDWTEPR